MEKAPDSPEVDGAIGLRICRRKDWDFAAKTPGCDGFDFESGRCSHRLMLPNIFDTVVAHTRPRTEALLWLKTLNHSWL